MNIEQSCKIALHHPNHPSNIPYSYVWGRFLEMGGKSDRVKKKRASTPRYEADALSNKTCRLVPVNVVTELKEFGA